MTPDNAIIKVIKNRKFYTFNYDFKNKDMVLDDSNSDINGHQMIWRKKLQNQISIVLWLIAMIMLIFRLMDMGLVVDNLKHKKKK